MNLKTSNLPCNEVSLSDLISGYVCCHFVVYKLDPDDTYTIWQKMKAFLLTTCRHGSKRYSRIQNAQVSMLKDYGIYHRLVYDIERDRVEYIAGQDYPSEIKTLKELIGG